MLALIQGDASGEQPLSLEIDHGTLERGEHALGAFGLRLCLKGIISGGEAQRLELDGVDVSLVYDSGLGPDSLFVAHFRHESCDSINVVPQRSKWSGNFWTAAMPHLLTELEERRDGRNLMLKIAPRGRAYAGAKRMYLNINTNCGPMEVPRSKWTDLLQEIGFQDFISIEIPITRRVDDDRYEKGVECLRAGMRHYARGEHDKVVGECRNVLDKLKQAGFGGHAPGAVFSFIKENAKNMSMPERASVLQAALHIYCSPAAHADEKFNRPDSTFGASRCRGTASTWSR